MPAFEQETRPATVTVPKQTVLRHPPGTQSASVEQPVLNIRSTHCPPKHVPSTPPGRVHWVPFGVLALQEAHEPPPQPKPALAQLKPQTPQLLSSRMRSTQVLVHKLGVDVGQPHWPAALHTPFGNEVQGALGVAAPTPQLPVARSQVPAA